MGQGKLWSFYFSKHQKVSRGFSMVEVVVALFFVTLAVFIIGSLSQQVINFRKSTSQTGALIELKTLTSTVARNPDKWLVQMKSIPDVASIYSGCLSEISTATGYNCPTPSLNNTIINGDTRLQEYATGMFVIDTPLVDSLGRKIAGTQAIPHYMHSDGRACNEIDKTNCALQSVGYFMRSNSAIDQDPGQVKFVMKVERTANANLVKVGNFPMKPQYMSIDLGEDWKNPTTSGNPAAQCPTNTVQVGYLSDGTLQCINPTLSCTGPNEVQIGINSNGTPKCQAPATPCSAPNSFVVFDPNSGGLTCAATSPCTTGTFSGYYSGTGDPICQSDSPGCDSTPAQKKVQMGQDSNGDPICANVATCSDSLPALAFNGSNFVCEAGSPANMSATSCPAGQAVTSINADGTALCSDVRTLAGSDGAIGNNGENGTNGSNSSSIAIQCRVKDFRSTGDSNHEVCCDEGETAMSGAAPGDTDFRFGFVRGGKCMVVSEVGRNNPVQLQCCKASTVGDSRNDFLGAELNSFSFTNTGSNTLSSDWNVGASAATFLSVNAKCTVKDENGFSTLNVEFLNESGASIFMLNLCGIGGESGHTALVSSGVMLPVPKGAAKARFTGIGTHKSSYQNATAKLLK